MCEKKYPSVLSRVKAAMFDYVVIIIFMFMITYILSHFENLPNIIRVLTFIFIFILYDPIFTSIFGGTLGHLMIGIRVKRGNDETKNILFLLAVIRFIVKAILGLVSLFTVTSNEKRKAIHDYLVGSIVVFKESK